MCVCVRVESDIKGKRKICVCVCVRGKVSSKFNDKSEIRNTKSWKIS